MAMEVLVNIGLGYGFVIYLPPSHYLNQCWHIFNPPPPSPDPPTYLEQISLEYKNAKKKKISQENAFENIVWEMLTSLLRP